MLWLSEPDRDQHRSLNLRLSLLLFDLGARLRLRSSLSNTLPVLFCRAGDSSRQWSAALLVAAALWGRMSGPPPVKPSPDHLTVAVSISQAAAPTTSCWSSSRRSRAKPSAVIVRRLIVVGIQAGCCRGQPDHNRRCAPGILNLSGQECLCGPGAATADRLV